MLLSCDNTERAALRCLKWATHDAWEWPVEEDEGLNMSRTFPGTMMITRHGGSTEARAPVFRHPAAPSVSNTETGYYNLCIPIGKCSPRICQLNLFIGLDPMVRSGVFVRQNMPTTFRSKWWAVLTRAARCRSLCYWYPFKMHDPISQLKILKCHALIVLSFFNSIHQLVALRLESTSLTCLSDNLSS